MTCWLSRSRLVPVDYFPIFPATSVKLLNAANPLAIWRFVLIGCIGCGIQAKFPGSSLAAFSNKLNRLGGIR